MEQAVARCRGQLRRRRIGAAGIFQPQPILDHGEQLRGEEPALRLQMARPLAPEPCDVCQFGIEEDQRLGAHPAVLDAAETERRCTLAGFPRGAAEEGHGIGEARTIDVEFQPMALRGRGNIGHFLRLVAASVFARLRDRHGLRLNLVHVLADAGDHRLDPVRREFGPFAFGQDQLGPVGVKSGRTAFISLDMGLAVTDHPAVGRDHGSERQAVRRRARCHPQDGARPTEQVRKRIVQLQAQCVIVIGGIRRICGTHHLPQTGMDGSGIVGKKLHHHVA